MRCGLVWAAAAMLAAAAPHGARAQAPRSATARPVQPAQLSPGALCDTAIQAAERAGGMARPPPGLLGAIGIAESGRADPRTGRAVPWPWTINVAGEDHVFDTKADAIAAVLAAQAAGVQSIDVGCMQVNLMYHPAAFASLEQAFDPQANVVYAAAFLSRLFVQLGDWPHAAAAYHSQTPGIGEAYGRRVMTLWPLAAQFGGDLLGPPDDVPGPGGAAARVDAIDPNHVYTAAFRARLVLAAADRARRVAMGLVPAAAARHGGRGTPARLAPSGLARSGLTRSGLTRAGLASRLEAASGLPASTRLARAGP